MPGIAAPPVAGRSGLRAVVRREAARLRADGWDLAMLTWIPLLAYALLWWIFSAGLARDLPIVVVDADRSALSRTLVRMLDESPGIEVAAHERGMPQALALLRERRAFGVVVVPEDFERRLLAGRSAQLQWFYNGQFSAHVGGLTRDVRTVASTLSAGIEIAAREKRGVSAGQAAAQFEPIRLRLVTLFNEAGNYEAFLALAAIPGLMQIFFALGAVAGIGRELKHGSVPDWLAAAGGRWSVALAGKLALPALAFGLHGVLFMAFFAGVRGWRVEGSGVALALAMAGFVAASLGLGTLIAAATLSLRKALSIAAFVTAPAFAFSGQGYPLVAMPPLARAWGEALPLTHYLQLQSRHWLAGAPATHGATELFVLAAIAAGTLGLGLVLLQRRASRPEHWGIA
jgi:ABC-2 type transport system permease protein